MPAKTGESRTGASEQLTPLRNRALTKMDSGPLLSRSRIVNRFNAIRRQALIGLTRIGEPTTADNGLLAIPTGKDRPSTVWKDVPSGAESVTLIGDFGSTNWKVSRAEKQENGSISKTQLNKKVYPDDQVRRITVSEFIDNMVNQIADAYHQDQTETGHVDGPINIAVKFGFPHVNEDNEGRIDAIITDVAEDGTYSKNWEFSDWDPTQKVNVTAIMAERLRERGIDVASVVAKNDTNAVATDEDAAQRALSQRQLEIESIENLEELEPEKMTALARFVMNKRIKYREEGKEMPAEEAALPELVILDAGFVGGGGTNGAAKGGINLEIGRAKYSFDDYQEDDGEVHRKMQEMGLVKGDKHAEQETGAIIVARIAATLALLEEKKLLDNGARYARAILDAAKTNQKIVDEIAYGNTIDELASINDDIKLIQDVARGEMLRAGVNYGILIANVIAASLPDEGADQNVQYGLRVEGSTLLLGTHMTEVASQVTKELLNLRYPPEIIEADGDLGVASLAMSKKQLEQAAQN